MGRIITIAMLLGIVYWYWSGPYQARVNPSYDQKLRQNAENMRKCIRGKNYKIGATGEGDGVPEEVCASEYNLYYRDGQWHSYDDERPAN